MTFPFHSCRTKWTKKIKTSDEFIIASFSNRVFLSSNEGQASQTENNSTDIMKRALGILSEHFCNVNRIVKESGNYKYLSRIQ